MEADQVHFVPYHNLLKAFWRRVNIFLTHSFCQQIKKINSKDKLRLIHNLLIKLKTLILS